MPDTTFSPFLLHWPDSELAGVAVDSPTTLRLRFAAAFGRCGPQGVAGYLSPVELVFHGATWRGDAPALCLGGIAQGMLRVDGAPAGPAAHVSALPVDRRGAVVCEFRLMSGTMLRIEAQHLTGTLDAAARFRESFAC
ncbi:hypothetical protein [Sphaerotilus sp.]|uniref:hypothetical protein n=1 Tax=Sphaerotilus sp. TaxID=2093942 RepID=UPI002ACDFCFA|nr:hypothetical protein [Sphaerotilus sp.]MDZ7855569.1 hypothetical protein [Sphaerotilus sp.]